MGWFRKQWPSPSQELAEGLYRDLVDARIDFPLPANAEQREIG